MLILPLKFIPAPPTPDQGNSFNYLTQEYSGSADLSDLNPVNLISDANKTLLIFTISINLSNNITFLWVNDNNATLVTSSIDDAVKIYAWLIKVPDETSVNLQMDGSSLRTKTIIFETDTEDDIATIISNTVFDNPTNANTLSATVTALSGSDLFAVNAVQNGSQSGFVDTFDQLIVNNEDLLSNEWMSFGFSKNVSGTQTVSTVNTNSSNRHAMMLLATKVN